MGLWNSLQGLLQMGIRGVTVSDVRGFGAQGGSTERYEGIISARDCSLKLGAEFVVCGLHLVTLTLYSVSLKRGRNGC